MANQQLPKDIKAKDLEFPSFKSKDRIASIMWPGAQWHEQAQFELWYTTGMGWVIPTLPISQPGRRSMPGATRRTYAITLDGKIVTCGRGPHVTETHTVYVRESRLNALRHYLDLKRKGEADAGGIRDRISSRRAQGQMERAAGRTSWLWNR